MKLRRYPCWIAGGVAAYLATASPVWAQQISSDGTLSTSVTSSDDRNYTITEGNRAGDDLFHSFSQFSVPTGGEAFFDNALDVKNIISRVTGGAVSNINGLLRANGSANLFLLNPSGILFGPNAQINIGGSFLASTASSLKFAGGWEFSATDLSSPPLLRVSVPIGLQYGGTTAGIKVQGSTLAVQPEQTLALVGGEITIEGGNITAPGGRIDLGAVAGDGTVELTSAEVPLQLRFPDGIQRADISLTDAAQVNASGSRGGDIQLAGRRITLVDSHVEATTQGSEAGGDLTVSASQSVELIGNDAGELFDSGLFAETFGTGAAGDLSITTGQLVVQGSARVSAATFGAGDGGNLTVNAADSVELIGIDPPNDETLGTLFTGLLTDTESTGAAGDLTIQTRRLSVRDGAQVSAVTFGAGKGGNLTVNAGESIELIGVSPSDLLASGLFNAVQPTATGNAGDLTVNTAQLIIQDGAQIFAGTLGMGDGGNLTVNASKSIQATGVSPINLFSGGLFSSAANLYGSDTRLATGRAGNLTVNTVELIVQNGAQVATTTLGKTGEGGNLTVNALESAQVIGTGPVRPDPSDPSRVRTDPSGLFSSAFGGSSDSGNVLVNTGRLIVRDGALVAVDNQGSGNAGNLEITARSLLLENEGRLTAATTSGGGGNINLQVPDLLQLRRNSEISAQAGGTGNGGNIDINTDLLVALEDSGINANAFEGQGGNIQLTVQGLFLSPSSKITASSDQGIDGVVDIQSPEVDHSSGLVFLPQEVVDVTGLVAQGCDAGGKVASSEFIVTGRGGLPEDPTTTLRGETVLSDLRPKPRLGSGVTQLSTDGDNGSRRVQTLPPLPGGRQLHPAGESSHFPIVEATGWVNDANGQLQLVAIAPNATPQQPWQKPIACGDS